MTAPYASTGLPVEHLSLRRSDPFLPRSPEPVGCCPTRVAVLPVEARLRNETGRGDAEFFKAGGRHCFGQEHRFRRQPAEARLEQEIIWRIRSSISSVPIRDTSG